MRLLHRLFPRLHRWETIYTDDDECRGCGAWRLWPDGTILWTLTDWEGIR